MQETKETLHLDLKEYIDTSNGIPMIHHPLVVFPFYNEQLNHHINKMYEEKTKKINELIEKEEYENIIWFYERPYRLECFLKYNELMDEKIAAKLLKSIWIDCEHPHNNKEIWKILFNTYNQNIMSSEEIEYIKQLPPEITIYRGCDQSEIDNLGISWTTSEETAQWFANRFNNDGKIISKKIKKNEIIFYTNNRGENEIVYY